MRKIKKQKTICVRVFGGVGNQLFIYAFARALSVKNNYRLKFDIKTGFIFDKYGRRPKIQNYVPNLTEASIKDFLFFYFTKFFPRFSKLLFNAVIFFEQNSRRFLDMSLIYFNSNVTFVQGYFQSYLYFEDIAEKIKSEIVLDFEKSHTLLQLEQEILSSNSVSVHLRRMDYSNLLTLDYYRRAIEIIQNNIDKPLFFIFSDDLEWCKNNLKSNESNFIYVSHDVEDETADLYLMTKCKHHIIANSSFSWWGAYLSNHKNKQVIGPVHTQIGVKDNLYPKDWILI